MIVHLSAPLCYLFKKYCQKAILTVYGDGVWLTTVFTALCLPLPLKCWLLTLMNASNQTPLLVSLVCFHRNKAILFYFNMLKCANPAVLINLQCPTTQVRGQVMPTYSHSALCSSPTFPPWLIMHDWWALSLRGRVASCSSVSPSALTDLQLFLMHGIPKTGNISSSSASRASRLAVRWERGLFCIFASQLKIHLLNAKLKLPQVRLPLEGNVLIKFFASTDVPDPSHIHPLISKVVTTATLFECALRDRRKWASSTVMHITARFCQLAAVHWRWRWHERVWEPESEVVCGSI